MWRRILSVPASLSLLAIVLVMYGTVASQTATGQECMKWKGGCHNEFGSRSGCDPPEICQWEWCYAGSPRSLECRILCNPSDCYTDTCVFAIGLYFCPCAFLSECFWGP